MDRKLATCAVLLIAVLFASTGTLEVEKEFADMLRIFFRITASYRPQNEELSSESIAELTKPVHTAFKELHSNMYDFIVVGSGSSGSVVANRLSENPHWNVLVLEAGSAENLLTRRPIASTLLQATDYNWKYLMEFQPDFGKGMEGQLITWPSGKALGGSSVINNNIYSRGNPHDYDLWGRDNPGWSYDDVLPYFMRSERCRLHDYDSDYHSEHGEVGVEDTYQPQLMHSFVEAGAELGYHKYVDYNSPRQVGFASMQGTLLNGKRHSAARAYVLPILDRKNLDVQTEAFVLKLLINPHTRFAYAVEYIKGGERRVAYARKEIILSAGTFNSPKLLMLSGVGPREHIEHFGIHVIKDLPVGRKLYDHLMYLGLVFKSRTPLTFTPLDILNPFKADSPSKSLGGYDGIAFFKTNASDGHRPDAALLLQSQSFATEFGKLHRPLFRIRGDLAHYHWDHLSKHPTFTILPMILHPKSCGSVKLRSPNPYDPPHLFGNYYSDHHGEDVKTMIEAIRFAIALAQTDTFKHYDVSLVHTPVPGCEWYQYGTDHYWECAIRTLSYTAYNQIGTNRMGNDSESVVDHELKVHGVAGLRVADASVIPVTLGAHMNAPALMIGEKAADLIKHDWEHHEDHDHGHEHHDHHHGHRHVDHDHHHGHQYVDHDHHHGHEHVDHDHHHGREDHESHNGKPEHRSHSLWKSHAHGHHQSL